MTTTRAKPPAKRRRFRFGLRTLLAVVTLAAVASWGYWVAWPRWREYRERAGFESAVKRLKIGDTIDTAFDLLTPGRDIPTVLPPPIRDRFPAFSMSTYESPGATYCVFFTLPTEAQAARGQHCTGLQVYRLPPMPPGYRRQTKVQEFPLMHAAVSDPICAFLSAN